jgi:Skp family chaperone for outer membrane proteins
MADEMVVLQCEACSTRLKIRAVTARIMKDVKCPKCGRKVSTKSLAPGGEPAPAAPVTAPAPAPVPVSIPAPAPAPVVASESVPVPVPAAPVVVAPVDDTALQAARARVAELEQQVQILLAKVADVTAAAQSSTADADLLRARQEIAEQEQRLAELQKLWLEKEKEARTAQLVAQRAQQERKALLDQMEAVLRSYHDAEIEAATDRINNLNVRLQNFLAQQIAKASAG